MKENRSTGIASRKIIYYAASAIAVGSAIGMIFGLMMFETLALGCAIGALAGLIAGVVIDAYDRR
jgi:uncharacterized membrane protein